MTTRRNSALIPIKILRKIHSTVTGKSKNNFSGKNAPGRRLYHQKEYSNELISSMINSEGSFMISRIGSTELACIKNYLAVKNEQDRSYIKYITNQRNPWWWESWIVKQIKDWSGFFPSDPKSLSKFCELYLTDIQEIDLLGAWQKEEDILQPYLTKSKRVILEDLEPFFTNRPWTHSLANKKVVVVHPFHSTILSQYAKRKRIFPDKLLPDFELKVIPAVQSLGGHSKEHKTWFDALDYMKNQLDLCDYDIAIIGAGAYGLPLAAHVKRMEKKAIHLGGVTQILFGIIGKRWLGYHNVWPYENLMNEHWVRPGEKDRSINAQTVEDACYW